MSDCRCGRDCTGADDLFDCSKEAQAARRRQLADLEAKLYSGVSSVSDRSRSVSYHNTELLIPLINRLRNEIAFCILGFWPRSRRRVFHLPLVKGL
jgi:hypothetical protein